MVLPPGATDRLLAAKGAPPADAPAATAAAGEVDLLSLDLDDGLTLGNGSGGGAVGGGPPVASHPLSDLFGNSFTSTADVGGSFSAPGGATAAPAGNPFGAGPAPVVQSAGLSSGSSFTPPPQLQV